MDRIGRVNEQIKREIGLILQRELGDPRLQFVTITGVEVSRDLRTAKVYFSALGDKPAAEAARQALKSATGIIRRCVGENVKMRYTPEFHFFHDRSVELSARVEQTLMEIHHDEMEKDPKRDPNA